MFWIEEKLAARIDELEPYRYRDPVKLRRFLALTDAEGAIGARPPTEGDWEGMQLGERWQGRDRYVWLAADVEIPSEWKGRKSVGLFDFGKTDPGNCGGFEALLYLNGQPYQGVDVNHKEVFLPPGSEGQKLSLCFRLWSGLEGGGEPREQEHRLNKAELAWLDEAADDLYYTAKATLATIKELAKEDPARLELLNALDRALFRLDWAKPGSDRHYDTIADAQALLRSEIGRIGKSHPVSVTCIGHTHIDVAWLWRLKHTREKSARSFSTVLRLMEMYPEYTFLQSQPQLYAYIKEDYPEIFAQLKRRIEEGRWEAGGAMWLEADCNIPSGESLVRQILTGTRYLAREFGVRCTYLWLPDVFGYSWALPQILKQSGIDTFMTTKISWNQYNRLPHDTFFWRGIDGTEILTHFITTPEKSDMWWYTYNGDVTPFTVKGIWDGYQDKNVNRELLLAYGYGDGGGGVNRDMLEMRRRLQEMPGLPNVETGRADTYFDRLQRTVAETDRYVHTWDGELYLEYHRGTYTSQAAIKRWNRKLELMLRETEWLNTIRSAGMAESSWQTYPQQALNQAWTIVLRNQFHDIIPGSSIREVYEDGIREYEEARLIVEETWREATLAIADPSPSENGVTLFNGSSRQRSDLVRLESWDGDRRFGLRDAAGNRMGMQVATDGSVYVFAENLPAMGFATFDIDDELVPGHATPFLARPDGIVTPFYEVSWNGKGQLTRIYDLENRRELLRPGECGNVLQAFEDKPKNFDAWDIDIFYQEKMREVDELVSVAVKDIGELFASIEFVWTYMDSRISQEMIVYANDRRIDFATRIDWKERQQLLKAAFPVNVRATEATYDIQYGNVKRPTHWNTSWDGARFETVGHQWADLSERGYGVSLLNDCKYGYDIKDHVMRLSLIKSAIWPDPSADEGIHQYTYALYPHEGDWCAGGTVEAAWALNNPIRSARGSAFAKRFSLFEPSASHVMIDAVKKAEDGNRLVLRVHEFAGARGAVTIRSDATIRSWQLCNLLEEPTGERIEDSAVTFSINPYEIKTFIIDMG
ncbi:alpha-mannosidase [Cohnella panacarvi]|uniref:alpha-mannosidase n=1 Tax=Cohnella panacarvi TaxID=400776 RepID=UPI00047B6C25|nr:alpha-mannosidase [Cohnella panacarvi]